MMSNYFCHFQVLDLNSENVLPSYFVLKVKGV